jgi:hypothetical protein
MAVLLRDIDGIVEGRWAGDPLYAIGDTHKQTVLHQLEGEACDKDVLDILKDRYVDITPLLIDHLCVRSDVREEFLQAADSDPVLLIDLMHIAEHLGSKHLRQSIKERYKGNWHELYSKRYALLVKTGRSAQVRQIHPQLINNPKPSPDTSFARRQRFYLAETDVERAHVIEVVAIENNVITANVQCCPDTHLDDKPVKGPTTGITYFGKMHNPDKLLALRVLLSCWNNLPSGLHFSSLAVEKSEARSLHERAAYCTELATLSKLVWRRPTSIWEARHTAGYPNRHRWIGKPYRSSSQTGIQVSSGEWEQFEGLHEQAEEYIASVEPFLTENQWYIPLADEVVKWVITVRDPAFVDFLRVGMRWKCFGAGVLCRNCQAVDLGEFVETRHEYNQVHQSHYEERGTVFTINEYRCHACGKQWSEARGTKYRDSGYP